MQEQWVILQYPQSNILQKPSLLELFMWGVTSKIGKDDHNSFNYVFSNAKGIEYMSIHRSQRNKAMECGSTKYWLLREIK